MEARSPVNLNAATKSNSRPDLLARLKGLLYGEYPSVAKEVRACNSAAVIAAALL